MWMNRHTSGTRRRHGWMNQKVVGIGLASIFSDASDETVTALLPAFLASMGVAAGALGTIEGLAEGLSSVGKLAWNFETNLIRLTETWAEVTTAAITDVRDQAAAWVPNEQATLEGVLNRTGSESDRIRNTLALTREQPLSVPSSPSPFAKW